MIKLFSIQSEQLRQARRENNLLLESNLPNLWILSPSCSTSLINGFGAKLNLERNWCEGVYFLPEFFKTALIAINQLPTSEATLWLRLLGRGKIQKQAVEELLSLAVEHPLRRNILEILANWRINVEVSENVNDEDRELLMNLSPAYLRWREDTLQEGKQEGKQEGRQEGQRLMVENFLEARFGSLDRELLQIIDALMQLNIKERTQLLINCSREELLERFRQ